MLKVLWNDIVPFYIINEFEAACILRWGKFHRVSESGIYWKLPFGDYVYAYHIRTQTTHLTPQSLTTADVPKKSIVLKAIVRFHVHDVKAYTLNVYSAHDALCDTTQGIVAHMVKNYTWEQILEEGVEETICDEVNAIVNEWGITVEKITLSDQVETRTYRLITTAHENTTLLS